jgi:integrase
MHCSYELAAMTSRPVRAVRDARYLRGRASRAVVAQVDLRRRRIIAGTDSRSLDGWHVVTAPKTACEPTHPRTVRIAVEALSQTRRQGDLVWPHADGGPIPASSFTKPWRAMARRAGIRVVIFHALRHIAATLALEDGHALVATTLRLYADVTHASV